MRIFHLDLCWVLALLLFRLKEHTTKEPRIREMKVTSECRSLHWKESAGFSWLLAVAIDLIGEYWSCGLSSIQLLKILEKGTTDATLKILGRPWSNNMVNRRTVRTGSQWCVTESHRLAWDSGCPEIRRPGRINLGHLCRRQHCWHEGISALLCKSCTDAAHTRVAKQSSKNCPIEDIDMIPDFT